MNAIRSVFAAFANLAASLNALAGVIDTATGRLQQQLAAEGAAPILEHQPAGDGDEPGTSSTKRGRKATA